MIRVFIADSHPIVRNGIKHALSFDEDIEVIGEASNGSEVIQAAREMDWDVLFLDLSLPQKNGWEVLRRMQATCPERRTIVTSLYGEALYAVRAMKIGASGYIIKSCEPSAIVKAAQMVYSGKRYVSEELAGDLAEMLGASSSRKGKHDLLTDREMQVFILLAEDKRLVDIADDLNISVKTVGTFRRRILDKLKLKSNGDIVRYAMRAGMVM